MKFYTGMLLFIITALTSTVAFAAAENPVATLFTTERIVILSASLLIMIIGFVFVLIKKRKRS